MSQPDRLIRSPECCRLTGLSRTTIWRLEKMGRFPGRVRITDHIVGWRLSEISEWIANRHQRVVLEEAMERKIAMGLE